MENPENPNPILQTEKALEPPRPTDQALAQLLGAADADELTEVWRPVPAERRGGPPP